MDMQDNEFDQLFRSKLNDLEIEPSSTVWQGVNEGLGDNKRKNITPLLSIAASIIVLIAAGILFMPKKAILHSKRNIAVIKPKVNAPIASAEQQATSPNTASVALNKPAVVHHMNKNGTVPLIKIQDIKPKSDLPVPQNDPQVLVLASSSKNDIKQVRAIDSLKTLATVIPQVKNNEVVTVMPDKQATTPPAEKISSTSPVKKHGIHGIGDVLNVVIAAVDKRKDKIIEFADSDGDGATITAVNLGPIKVKKEN